MPLGHVQPGLTGGCHGAVVGSEPCWHFKAQSFSASSRLIRQQLAHRSRQLRRPAPLVVLLLG